MRVVSDCKSQIHPCTKLCVPIYHILLIAFYSYFDSTPLMVFGALNLIFALVALSGLGVMFIVRKITAKYHTTPSVILKLSYYLMFNRINPGIFAISHTLFGLPSLLYWLISSSMLYCSSSTDLATTLSVSTMLPIAWADQSKQRFQMERQST